MCCDTVEAATGSSLEISLKQQVFKDAR